MTDPEIEKRILELEKMASKVLELKRQTMPRRPIVIEFAGSPKAGKSSCISSLDIFLRRNSFRTKVLTERASVCPIPNKFDPIFNVWTACAALNQLSETLSNYSKSLDVIILDRGFFDALCWFEWQKEERLLRKDDYDRFSSFFTSSRFRMNIDLVLLFEAAPKTSSEREYKNLLTRRQGSIMREEVLTGYLQSLRNTKNKYDRVFPNVINYNTDNQDQNKVSYEVTKLTLQLLQNLANEKIGFIEKQYIHSVGEVFDYSDISGVVDSNLKFDERKSIEENNKFVQLLPIAVIKDKDRDEFVIGVKTEKATSKISAERGKVLCYFGGHLREEDLNLIETGSKLDAIKQCVYREVKEEIGIDIDPEGLNPKCIWVKDGSKSENHIAIVFVIEVSLSRLKLNIDGAEFAKYEKKGRPGTGLIMSAYDIHQSKIDSWTRNILEKILDVNYSYKDPTQPTMF